eukprot:2596066-Rhodomonas_salina.1
MRPSESLSASNFPSSIPTPAVGAAAQRQIPSGQRQGQRPKQRRDEYPKSSQISPNQPKLGTRDLRCQLNSMQQNSANLRRKRGPTPRFGVGTVGGRVRRGASVLVGPGVGPG